MKILIATPLYPPDVGGPSYYAKNLAEELRSMGHEVIVVSFGRWKKLPSGIRHLVYTAELTYKLFKTDVLIGLDSVSAGIPAVIASRIVRRPIIVRVSGDFLWEQYIERTDEPVTSADFYSIRERWSQKDAHMFRIIRWALQHVDGLVFQNNWQRELFVREYGLADMPSKIIRNNSKGITMHPHSASINFVWAGRDIKLKNLSRLKEAYAIAQKKDARIQLDIYTALPQQELFEKIKDSYAIIVPSISEMNPNLVLEGLSFGKPFICTVETGVREVVENLGIFVDPFDTNKIADAMLTLAKPDVYAEYIARIAAYRGEHTYRDIAQEFLLFFKQRHAFVVQ